MFTKTKNIHLLFIWLVGLMFFSHGIMPHHHHFDSAFAHNKPIHQSDENSEDNPAHCHALNDLLIVKVRVSAVKVVELVPLNMYVSNDVLDLFRANPVRIKVFPPPDDGFPDIVFFTNAPARGSPAIA